MEGYKLLKNTITCQTGWYLQAREKMINEISNFGTKAKLRVIKYDSEENQLFTGDEAGRITVWSLKTGSPICKLFKNYF